MVRMERHKCKLCSRSFSSGRALGGHMRSHLANFPLPPKTPQKQENRQPPPVAVGGGGGGGGGDSTHEESSTSSECSFEEEEKENSTSTNEDQKGLVYGLRENPKKSFRLADPQFLDAGLVVVQDRESESESSKKLTRRRSKRARRMVVNKQPSSNESMVELEQVSSVSNTSPEEDLAMCLIMLSRDVWSSSSTSDDSQQELKLSNKVVSSISCKKMKINCCEDNYDQECELEELPRNVVCSIKNVVDKKVHVCPFCGKVFGSGQALGGHKRSHFSGSTTTTTTTTATAASVSISAKLAAESLLVESSSSAKFQHGMLMIDLNLPAPMEEEEDEDDDHHERNENSFIQEVSAVSDADFINPIKH